MKGERSKKSYNRLQFNMKEKLYFKNLWKVCQRYLYKLTKTAPYQKSSNQAEIPFNDRVHMLQYKNSKWNGVPCVQAKPRHRFLFRTVLLRMNWVCWTTNQRHSEFFTILNWHTGFATKFLDQAWITNEICCCFEQTQMLKHNLRFWTSFVPHRVHEHVYLQLHHRITLEFIFF